MAHDIRDLADEEVMQLVQRGDPRAFELLYDRHGGAAYSLADNCWARFCTSVAVNGVVASVTASAAAGETAPSRAPAPSIAKAPAVMRTDRRSSRVARID